MGGGSQADLYVGYGWQINILSLWLAAQSWQQMDSAVVALSIAMRRKSAGTLNAEDPSRSSLAALPVELLERIKSLVMQSSFLTLEDVCQCCKQHESKVALHESCEGCKAADFELECDKLDWLKGERPSGKPVTDFLEAHGLEVGRGNNNYDKQPNQVSVEEEEGDDKSMHNYAVCVSLPIDILEQGKTKCTPVNGVYGACFIYSAEMAGSSVSVSPDLLLQMVRSEARLTRWLKTYKLRTVPTVATLLPTNAQDDGTVDVSRFSDRPQLIMHMEAGTDM